MNINSFSGYGYNNYRNNNNNAQNRSVKPDDSISDIAIERIGRRATAHGKIYSPKMR